MKDTTESTLSIIFVTTIVFVILKLIKIINWSWWWVLSPFWISAALTIVIAIAVTIHLVIKNKKKHNEIQH